jgi:hypothetical protein
MDDNARRKRRRGKTPTVAEVIAEIRQQFPENPPLRRPPWPPSQFDKLYNEFGGPADLGMTVEKNTFRRCCQELSLGRVLPTLLQFATDETSARRHWPWAAFAINQYEYEIKERAKDKDKLKPKEIHDLIKEIERAAHDLRSGLAQLQTLAFRPHEHSAPLLRPHLSWLDEFISQAVSGRISNEVTDDDIVTVFVEKMNFLKQLAEVEAVAKIAAKRVDVDMLKRKREQSNPALPNFVRLSGKIWKGMTGREPSTRRVERLESGDPDFVIFVKALAKIGNCAEPSRKAIETARRNQRATD